MAAADDRPVPPGADPAGTGASDNPATCGDAGVAEAAGVSVAPGEEACVEVRPGQQVVVKVETRRMGRGLTAFIVVAVSLVLLGFAGCSAAVSGCAGALGMMAGMDDVSADYAYGPQVAVFHMDQAIDASAGITPELVRAVVTEVDADPNVVALVVRCDCPGGGAAASEEIAAYIAGCSKPVVFSVGTVCASGAYMAASQADLVMANATSEVGSIGTIVTVYDLEDLFETLGVAVEVVKSSDAKDMGASYRALTDEERAELQAKVDRITEVFVDMVAAGRGIDEAVVEGWANGTTYLGEDALEMGMIDALGTYDDALRAAAELAGVDYDDVQLVSFDPSYSELDVVGSLLGF